MTTIAKLYPMLVDLYPSLATLDFVDNKRRNFIKSTLHFIQSANLLTPFLRQRISRLLIIEKHAVTKTNMPVLSDNLVAQLWKIYGDISDSSNCSFKKHLKSLSYKLNPEDKANACKLSRITRGLFENLKNKNRTRNTELQQFISSGSFNTLSAIRHLQSRINFKLNFIQTDSKNLIPIVLSNKIYHLPLNQCNTEQFEAARQYYKTLLKTHFSKYFARVEIGLKLDKDYNAISEYFTLIHCHAFVDADEYKAFLETAKKHRAKCRKNGTYTSLFKLKCKKLIKKQEKQTLAAFLSREIDYACKFALLDGTEGPDFYKTKVTRLDFAQVFHQKHSQFINQVVLNNYNRSLLISKTEKWSFSTNRLWFENNQNPEVKKLIKIYRKLAKFKIKITTKTKETVQVPSPPLKPKIDAATRPKTLNFWQKIKLFWHVAPPPPPPRLVKPPD
jgi:hypothetical protein